MRAAAIRVFGTVEGEAGAAHLRQGAFQRPAGEGRIQPALDPGVQHPGRLVTMQARQLLERCFGAHMRLGVANALQGPGFRKDLGRDHHQGLAGVGPLRRRLDGHAAAHAVAQRDEAVDLQRIQHGRQEVACFFGHEVQRRQPGARVGPAEAQAVIGQHRAARGPAQGGGKVAPGLHAAQGFMQQHQWCRIWAFARGCGLPLPREKPASGMGDPVVCRRRCGGHAQARKAEAPL